MRAELNDLDNRNVIGFRTHRIDGTMYDLMIGQNNIKDMRYHTPIGDGDKHFIDVYYSDGSVKRFFDIVQIFASKEL